jgi:hypothetical protein
MVNASTLTAHSSVFVILVIDWALTGRYVLVSIVKNLSTSIQTGFVYIQLVSKLMIKKWNYYGTTVKLYPMCCPILLLSKQESVHSHKICHWLSSA